MSKRRQFGLWARALRLGPLGLAASLLMAASGEAQQAVPPTKMPLPTAKPAPTLSIISMIAGILGLLGGFFYGLGGLFSIAAVVLGFIGKKKEPEAKGFWLTGIITGFVGIALSAIVIVFVIIIIAIAASTSYTYSY